MKSVSGTKKLISCSLLALLLGLAACSSDPKKEKGERPDRVANPFKKGGALDGGGKTQLSERDLRLEAGELYKLARRSLENGDYADAQLRYGSLVQRYPFTEYASQSELERIYSLHKEFKPDEALSAADRFLREHPRYPAADYVQYLKGVISAERDASLLEAIPFLDSTQGDTSNLRRSFDEFALLVQKYPSSRYNADARARMADLRNRLAAHEMHVVRYYVKRGAFLAATKRAEQVLALYPGAPSTVEALNYLRISYQQLGLKQQAEDANALYLQQSANLPAPQAPVKKSRFSNVLSLGAEDRVTAPVDAVPAPAVAAPQAKGGFFSWLAGLFSFADTSTSKPVELLIPANAVSITPVAVEADGKTPAAPAKRSKLSVEINTGDEAAKPAPPAKGN